MSRRRTAVVVVALGALLALGVGLAFALLDPETRARYHLHRAVSTEVHLDAGEIVQKLRQVRTVWLLPVILSIFVRFWLTAVRWQVLLRPVKPIGLHRLFGVIMIGFMANNVLPARIGELVRAYALGRSEALAAPLAFATIVIERVFDGFTLQRPGLVRPWQTFSRRLELLFKRLLPILWLRESFS